MIYIQVECHTNQYQACAWGNHHSEGVIDWPPAPWRLLRAVVAGSYNARLQDKYRPTLKTLLHKLAAALPSYTLPPITYIQHRSPRPQVDSKTVKVRPGKTLYSAGLLMSSDQNLLYIHWPVELTETEELVLNVCLSGLTYLGRKEAVASLSLAEEAPAPNAAPNPQGDRLVAIADESLDPEALWDALNLSAHENYGVNRSAVFPGIRQATYDIARSPSQRSPQSTQKQHLVTLTVNCKPRFPLKQSLKLTNRLHQSLVAHCPAEVFTGMDMGQPKTNHDHTIFWCVPDATGRYVEQVQLYSKTGYDQGCMAAIANCQVLQSVARGYDVNLSLADYGDYTDKRERWVSATPFFLTRFPAVRRGKPRMLTEQYQKDGPEHQVLQYLHYLSWLELEGTPSYQDHEEGLALYQADELMAIAHCEPFKNFWEWEAECRQGKKVGRLGYHVSLKFSQPVAGPIVLGYASHYGLGLMMPEAVRGGMGVQSQMSQSALVATH